MRTCEIENCVQPYQASGMCRAHYARKARGADMTPPIKTRGWRIKSSNEWNNILRRRRKDFVESLKAAPCMDCKNSFPVECMDFDHVRGVKLGCISEMVADGTGREKILAEIAKCDLVCANCHRIRTKARLIANA